MPCALLLLAEDESSETVEFQILDIVCLTDNELNALTQHSLSTGREGSSINQTSRRAVGRTCSSLAPARTAPPVGAGEWAVAVLRHLRAPQQKVRVCCSCDDEPVAIPDLTRAWCARRTGLRPSHAHYGSRRVPHDGLSVWHGRQAYLIQVGSSALRDVGRRPAQIGAPPSGSQRSSSPRPRDFDAHVRPFTIASDKLPLENQFNVITEVCPSKWARFPRRKTEASSSTSLAVECNIGDIVPLNDGDTLRQRCASPLTSSTSRRQVPQEPRARNVVAQINVSICFINSPGIVKTRVLCLHDTAPVDGVIVASFPNECASAGPGPDPASGSAGRLMGAIFSTSTGSIWPIGLSE